MPDCPCAIGFVVLRMGSLSHHAMAGEAAQAARMGRAATIASGLAWTIPSAAAVAIIGAIDISRI
jgi:hypothetical protein